MSYLSGVHPILTQPMARSDRTDEFNGTREFQAFLPSGHHLKLKSKQLLENGKPEVERATLAVSAKQRETDEAKATTCINQQLEALGISPFLR
jgi:hypothetical protein